MRAGLFLAGLSLSHSVDVLVVPVVGTVGRWRGPVLPLERDPDDVADLTARLATPAGRDRAQAVHPRPLLCRKATLAAAAAVADAAEGAALVHVFRTYLAPFLDVVLDRPRRPKVVLDVDDVESTTFARLGQPDEASRYAALEAHYLPLCDHVVTASDDDARFLAARYRLARVTPVPNAVRLPTETATLDPPPAAPYDLLFVGNLSYPPNAEGVRWLCQKVVPRLGQVTVAIVGSGPGPEVRALADDPRVTVAADVPDIGPWYARSRVAVVPVWSGGGTRTKVLEAFAHRRPVVTTTVGAEGLGPIGLVGADDPLLLADDPDAFAAACRRLLDDPALARDLAARGEEAVRTRATVDVVAPLIDAIVRWTLSG
jgi:glycosyltransferase involved in cell wall biosynthesis